MALVGDINNDQGVGAFAEDSLLPAHVHDDPSILAPHEQWWRDHYELFERHGFRLRPRFAPGWTPSWHTNGLPFEECEDAIVQKVCATIGPPLWTL